MLVLETSHLLAVCQTSDNSHLAFGKGFETRAGILISPAAVATPPQVALFSFLFSISSRMRKEKLGGRSRQLFLVWRISPRLPRRQYWLHSSIFSILYRAPCAGLRVYIVSASCVSMQVSSSRRERQDPSLFFSLSDGEAKQKQKNGGKSNILKQQTIKQLM